MKKVLFSVIAVLLLVAFGVSAYMVGSYLLDGKKQEERNNELAQMVEDARSTTAAAEETVPGETTETAQTESGEKEILEVYAGLYELNNDMVGWLEIPSTKLKYPVMQSPDEVNFYLDHDFDREDSSRGAIYAWEKADVNEPSDNITMFGHNMKDGSMFATLNNYVNKYVKKFQHRFYVTTIFDTSQQVNIRMFPKTKVINSKQYIKLMKLSIF